VIFLRRAGGRSGSPRHLLRAGRRGAAAGHGRRDHSGAYTDQGLASVEIFLAPKKGYGIRRTGDEIPAGSLLAKAGAMVTRP